MDLLFREQQAFKLTHPAMGTIMTHQSHGENSEEYLTCIQMEIERLEALFSRFRPGSDISRMNQAAGQNPVSINEETMQVLLSAQTFANLYPGTFDITVTPLVDLWRNASACKQPPAQVEIDRTIKLVNNNDLLLNPIQGTAGLRYKHQSIDLGGIAKGYAANRLIHCALAFGLHSTFSNLGGNVIVKGRKLDGSPWKIGIQHPRLTGQLIGAVSIENEAVVTSGDYQRFFIGKDGKHYHHIINPETGYPATSDLISVTIITPDAMLADVLSTLLFIAGLEKGNHILANHPECQAILVNRNCQTFITKGLCDRYTHANQNSPAILNPDGVFSK